MVGKEDLEGVKRSKKYNQNILYEKNVFQLKKKAKTKERERQGREEGTERGREGGEEEEESSPPVELR